MNKEFYNKYKNLFNEDQLPYQNNFEKYNNFLNEKNNTLKKIDLDSLDLLNKIQDNNIKEFKNDISSINNNNFYKNNYKIDTHKERLQGLRKHFPEEKIQTIEENPYDQKAIINFLNKKKVNKQISQIKNDRNDFFKNENLYKKVSDDYEKSLNYNKKNKNIYNNINNDQIEENLKMYNKNQIFYKNNKVKNNNNNFNIFNNDNKENNIQNIKNNKKEENNNIKIISQQNFDNKSLNKIYLENLYEISIRKIKNRDFLIQLKNSIHKRIKEKKKYNNKKIQLKLIY